MINIDAKSNYNDSIPPRITFGGPINNYISSLSKDLLEARSTQKFEDEEFYYTSLFSGKKEFISKDSGFLTIIVQYPFVALIKAKSPSNIIINSNNMKKDKKKYTYGIFRNSKFYILDLTNPGLNFTDECCQLIYKGGVLTEKTNNTQVVYNEVNEKH
ncbi:hypothetical protein [Sphingobacterium sp.]|uniref:hypothetical protein n=1 Tax=Sphingobacterium sp. TaxID=341027 RepID=UPI0028A5ECEE|nr:hypothetical protein [Sphingobacterium sp.]